RTQYVPNNPNLLRAIAEEGHTIADHTHKHMPLSNEVTATHYEELTLEQQAILPDDFVTSYDTLQHIVGDLRDGDGRPSLSTLFRPPTLAISKSGLTAVFDCGFTHSISGYYSTGDYKAESAEKLAKQIKRNLKSGAVIVMHFSDTAKYTPDALDICLTELESEKKPFRFVGLNSVF
ncbi:MAG: polysaccharide deacetylase family protein, partial [Clostridia bacterium]|nr:polysaccharide deacetylase family protein [Clostridia bacterium]